MKMSFSCYCLFSVYKGLMCVLCHEMWYFYLKMDLARILQHFLMLCYVCYVLFHTRFGAGLCMLFVYVFNRILISWHLTIR